MESAAEPRWYALAVKPRLEKVVARNLEARGYEGFLPLARHRRRWSDRWKEITLPLFPGYVFCRFDLSSDRRPVLTIPGVHTVTGFGQEAAAVDPAELDSVRALLESGVHCQPWPFLAVGEKVTVERGALAGLDGIVTKVRNEYRLVISVSLLQRSVAVEIDREDVRRSRGSRRHRREEASANRQPRLL